MSPYRYRYPRSPAPANRALTWPRHRQARIHDGVVGTALHRSPAEIVPATCETGRGDMRRGGIRARGCGAGCTRLAVIRDVSLGRYLERYHGSTLPTRGNRRRTPTPRSPHLSRLRGDRVGAITSRHFHLQDGGHTDQTMCSWRRIVVWLLVPWTIALRDFCIRMGGEGVKEE